MTWQSPYMDVPNFDQFVTEIRWMRNLGIAFPDSSGNYNQLTATTRAEMALFMWRMAGSPTNNGTSCFSDMTFNLDYNRAICWAAARGISTGWPDGTFRPYENVARDAVAAFLYRYAGSPAYSPPGASPFSDVSTSNMFYKEISWLASRQISTGWPDGTFRPLLHVARDAMAAFLYRGRQQGLI